LFLKFENICFRTRRRPLGKRKPYKKCEYCNKTFSGVYSFILHMRSHTGEELFNCSQCEESFSKASLLKEHLRVHTVEENPCPVCPRTFSWSGNLQKHMQTHTGETPNKTLENAEKPFSCTYCLKHFSNSSDLKVHMRILVLIALKPSIMKLVCSAT